MRGTLSYDGSANAVVRLLGSSKPEVIRTPTLSLDREFVFSPVPPGRYVLTAVVGGETKLPAWQAIDISTQPAPTPLVLNPTATLRGRVIVEGVPTALNAVSIGAALLDGTTDVDALLQNSAEVDATGRFELTGLFGDRRLRLLNQPTNCAFQRLRKTGRPIESLSFSGGEVLDGVEVVLTCY